MKTLKMTNLHLPSKINTKIQKASFQNTQKLKIHNKFNLKNKKKKLTSHKNVHKKLLKVTPLPQKCSKPTKDFNQTTLFYLLAFRFTVNVFYDFQNGQIKIKLKEMMLKCRRKLN